MVGITLSPEQIRSAPPEVRQWLEHEIARSLGLHPVSDTMAPDASHLVGCSPQEAMTIYETVRGMLPVVNVFFELGREGAKITESGVQAFRLADMLRHTHLPDLERLVACLQVIDRAFQQIHNEDGAALFVLDPRGYCVVTVTTQQSVLAVWTQEIAAQQLLTEYPAADARVGAPPTPAMVPFSMTGSVPPTSINLGMPFSAPTAPSKTARAKNPGR
ncbi:hypothetical protein GCM10007881_08160 [Mesorhizobium huakuii]|uniref:hypothetical protein n=1 Tax=Mesorhizobium huakuii TaxID=28104 RepID=UPI00235B99AA|nr:hypothetical protein [Mesorhizobium huakuii]GLQ77300.1 hypothetical protein GCM10007881_08160 [Mesorhizobium huakuii]